MARHPVGTRVGAVLSGNAQEVQFLGLGIYIGDRVPEHAVGMMAKAACEVGLTNPTIELDSGEVVYGCECWWGSEKEINERLELWRSQGAVIKNVSIAEVRARFRAEEAKGAN